MLAIPVKYDPMRVYFFGRIYKDVAAFLVAVASYVDVDHQFNLCLGAAKPAGEQRIKRHFTSGKFLSSSLLIQLKLDKRRSMEASTPCATKRCRNPSKKEFMIFLWSFMMLSRFVLDVIYESSRRRFVKTAVTLSHITLSYTTFLQPVVLCFACTNVIYLVKVCVIKFVT
jgi:hypothetical protein